MLVLPVLLSFWHPLQFSVIVCQSFNFPNDITNFVYCDFSTHVFLDILGLVW
jgi:hypothetical protein